MAQQRAASVTTAAFAVTCISISLLSTRVAAQVEPCPLPGLPASTAAVGPYTLSAAAQSLVRPLHVLDGDGTTFVFDGRRGLDLVLSGSTLDPVLPTLHGTVRVRTDEGEEVDVTPSEAAITRDPNGRNFTGRCALDLTRLQKPFQLVRLRGQIREDRGLGSISKVVHLDLQRGLAAQDLGPVRVSAVVEAPVGGAPRIAVTCTWKPAGGLADLPAPGTVVGNVVAELRTASGQPFRLSHTVTVDEPVDDEPAAGDAVPGSTSNPRRRVRKWVWRTDSEAAGELSLSWRSPAYRLIPFELDDVPVPPAGPPAMGRIQAQRMVLNGPLELPITAIDLLSPDADRPGDAPHPLLSAEQGGSLRFQLRRDLGPAGAGAIQAALAPRRGKGWGGWYWFSGRTNSAGEAVLANVVPGVYRLRVRFHPDGPDSRGPGYSLDEVTVTVVRGVQFPVPATDLHLLSGK